MTGKNFHYIFSGSVVERFGIPLMISEQRGCCGRPSCRIAALHTDLDIMFSTLGGRASFSGEGNILVEPFIDEVDGFTGFAKLIHLTPDNEGELISSKCAKDIIKSAVENTRVTNFPGHAPFCGMCEDMPKVRLNSKGPAMKLRLGAFFEADITLCIQCPEWPSRSDWAFRPRYWPSVSEADRIMSLGCHLVAKPAPSDNDKTSWRLSFSLAELELSKLVPYTARKCFLALKIIFKDHLQPVVPKITSYHMKTIFFNTLEKVPVGFWTENNIEECFRTLLAELCDALLSTNCPHHWFSNINLFKTRESCIKKRLHRLAKKVQRILNEPAPFIFDDGCCCLSACCFRAPHYNFTRRTNEQFLAEYDEVMVTAEERVASGSQNAVDAGNYQYQLPVSPSQICEAQLNPSSSSGGHRSQVTTTGHIEHVVSLPTDNAGQEPTFCAEDNPSKDCLPILVSSPLPQNTVT